MIIPNIWKKSCSKPPTRYCMFIGSDPLHLFSWTILNPSRWHQNSWWLIMTLRHKLGYSPSQPNATNRGYIHRCNLKKCSHQPFYVLSHCSISRSTRDQLNTVDIARKLLLNLMIPHWIALKAPISCGTSSSSSKKEYLVGGIPTPLKNMSQMGRILPNIWGKTKMFHTTNQIYNSVNKPMINLVINHK